MTDLAERTLAALWGSLRIVAIDVETTRDGAGGLRVVSIGAATCRAGHVVGRWQQLVDPEVPIDSNSASIHGITTDMVKGEAKFAAVANSLLSLLSHEDDELVVVAAHNVAFDIPVLAAEFDRVSLELPDLPTLDTMRTLPGLVGVRPVKKDLGSLIAELGIAATRRHDALNDAVACAEAVVELLKRAAEQGYSDIEELLTEAGSKTTTNVPASRNLRLGSKKSPPRNVPATHLTRHSRLLNDKPAQRTLDRWRSTATECAQLRCRYLKDWVTNSRTSKPLVLDQLTQVLTGVAASGDNAGAATVLGAILPILDALPPKPGRHGQRRAALEWANNLRQTLAAVNRCDPKDQCPACITNKPCPIDTWPTTVVRIALGDPQHAARGFIYSRGKRAGTGVYHTWVKQGHGDIADAGAWIIYQYWRSISQYATADRIAQYAWKAGCRHPQIAIAYAKQLAAPGRRSDLQAALHICDTTLAARAGNTDEAWIMLQARRAHIAGQLQRLTLRPSGLFDSDGNPIPIRKHHPETPKRTRPARFLRNEHTP